ncbi:hypothetical protein SUGI_1000030 [Cryptomeria japonica]|nr:hypothetical protein SUGI_1000030 [Cryptomeria japonica]
MADTAHPSGRLLNLMKQIGLDPSLPAIGFVGILHYESDTPVEGWVAAAPHIVDCFSVETLSFGVVTTSTPLTMALVGDANDSGGCPSVHVIGKAPSFAAVVGVEVGAGVVGAKFLVIPLVGAKPRPPFADGMCI